MLLVFADKRISEFANGSFHRKNDGQPFEVTDLLGNELLKAPTRMDGREITVFKEYSRKVSKTMLPDDFPMRDELEQNEIYTLEDVRALTLDSHTELTGIGKKTMQRILDAAAAIEDVPAGIIVPEGE